MTRAIRSGAILALALAACADGTPRQGGEAPDPLAALVDSLLPRLERLAGLEARAPVTVAVRSPAQVRAFVEHRLREDYPPETVTGIRDAYALLGLVPDTLDLQRLLADLYAEQIVGYYDPDSTTLYVTEGVPADALRPVLAHELVHALQDQHIALDSLIAPERGNDRQLAAQAAIEGHATLVMLAFLAGETQGVEVEPAMLPDPAAQIRAGLDGAAAYPVFQSAPRLLREILVFPYADGASFAWSVWAAVPVAERPPLIELIPASTEQVLAPATRFTGTPDMPTDVAFETGADGWRTVYENTFGALETGLFLELHGAPRGAATGWDGDRYRVLADAADRRALVWWSVWDDGASADAFAAAARQALAGRPHQVSRADAGRPAVLIRIGDAGAGGAAIPAGTLHCMQDGVCIAR